MTRVRLDLCISADGYIAGPDQGPDEPLGVGGIRLHQWKLDTGFSGDNLRPAAGIEEPSVDARVVAELFDGIGAYVMGRKMFGGGPGPWPTDEPWNGWWGEDPPYHAPVFVITHHPRETLELEGGNVFHFVTEGPQRALELAREAAAGQDVMVSGGADVANQLLAAGAIEEIQLHVAAAILGAGERLFEGVTADALPLSLDRVLQGADVTHLRYRVG